MPWNGRVDFPRKSFVRIFFSGANSDIQIRAKDKKGKEKGKPHEQLKRQRQRLP